MTTREQAAVRKAAARAAFWADPDDPRHGTPNGYSSLRCRCGRCRAAKTADMAEYWARRRARGGLTHNDPRHGLASTRRDFGCECDPCVAAWDADSKTWPTHLAELKRQLDDASS